MTADELEALVAKATQGEWLASPYSSVVGRGIVARPEGRMIGSIVEHDDAPGNASLITALVNNAPRLIEALRASEWQPIETAPRDGTSILAWEIDQAYFLFFDRKWRQSYDFNDPNWNPTAWRPLPAPPATETGE